MADDNGGQPNDNQGAENQGGTPPEFKAPASQEELDRIIESRLSRERSKYADYDDLKSKQAEYEQWKESQLTEQEKAVKAAREEGSSETAKAFQKRLVSSEVKATALAAGFNDPTDALVVIGDDLPLDKDGEPDTEKIGQLVKELAEKKPYLVAAGGPKPPAGKPKLPATKKPGGEPTGKGRAAAALRQFGKSRR